MEDTVRCSPKKLKRGRIKYAKQTTFRSLLAAGAEDEELVALGPEKVEYFLEALDKANGLRMSLPWKLRILLS